MIRFIQGHFINFFSPKVLSLCFIWKLEQGGDKRKGKSPTPSSLTLHRSLAVHEALLHLSPHLNFMQPGGTNAEADQLLEAPRHTGPSDSTSLYSNVPMIPCLPTPFPGPAAPQHPGSIRGDPPSSLVNLTSALILLCYM